MTPRAKLVICSLLFLLTACGREWRAEPLPGTQIFLFPSKEVLPEPESLRPSLIDCVKQNDPAYLRAVESGGDYEQGSSFPSDKENAVRKCMHEKGWANLPTTVIPSL